MVNHWQTVPLGEILFRIKDEIHLINKETYKQVTVRLWNKGVILRGERLGSEIQTKRQFLVHSGQLILSRIDVRNGAIGLCPLELEGAIVTNDFWVYDFAKSIYPEFLIQYAKTHGFIEAANHTSSGTTHRVRSEELAFLKIKIPLPPIDEQRRIVARIEALAERIDKARGLREALEHETTNLIDAILNEVFIELKNRFGCVSIEQSGLILNKLTCNPQKERTNEEFVYLDIASVENGTGEIKQTQKIFGRSAPSRARRLIKKDDVIISTVRPYLKAFALVPTGLDNQICSTGFAVFTCPPNILPKFLLYQFFSPYFIDQAMDSVTGGHYPALNDKSLKSIEITIPPLDEQRRIVDYVDNVKGKILRLRKYQNDSTQNIEMLMPSILDMAFKGEL